MKVKDTFRYFGAKIPVIVTKGFFALYQGDRENMPEQLKERIVEKYEFLHLERKFWICVRPRE